MTGKEAAPPKAKTGLVSRLLFAALVVAAIVFLARMLGPQTLGEQARRHLVKTLQQHYPEFDVSIRRGHYEPSVGLIFEDLQINGEPRSPNAGLLIGDSTPPMVRIERLVVVADTKPEKLLEKQNPLETKRIVVEGIHATAWLKPDGRVSLMDLLPLPSLGPAAPQIEIRRTNLKWLSGDIGQQPIDLNIDKALVVNEGSGETKQQTISINGSTSFTKRLTIKIHSSAQGLSFSGEIDQARLNADLIGQLPVELKSKLAPVAGLDCLCDISAVARKLTDQPIEFLAKTRMHDGIFQHKSLPSAITGLRGLATCRPSGIEVQAFQGGIGKARFNITGNTDGLQWPFNVAMTLDANGLLLNNQIAATLPAEGRRLFDLLQPHGHLDVVDAEIVHQSGKWKAKSATIQCKGIDVRFAKFPYPVQNLVGQINIKDGMAECERMSGDVGGTRLNCGFRMPVDRTLTNERLFVASTTGPIAINNTLLESLSPRLEPTSKLESFVRSLRPRGNIHLTEGIFRTDADGTKHQTLELDVKDGHLRYTKFAYPLYNVQGKVFVDDQLVRLKGFHAANTNAGTVLCDGAYRMPTKNNAAQVVRDSAMELNFRAAKIPMDESLRSSLPATAQSTWDSLAPSGTLDYLSVKLTQQGSGAPLGINLTASEVDTAKTQDNGQTLSLKPKALPYRLDITDGNVTYDGQGVVIESMRATHDTSRISTNGHCYRDKNGRWLLILDIHGGSRLNPDAQLIKALPDQMRMAMHRLQLRRPVSIRGRTALLMADEQNLTPQIDWDVVLQLEGNHIGDVGPVRSLRGEIKSRGRSNEIGVVAEGEVRIDSMHAYDLQLTSIEGPYSVQNDHLQLGSSTQVNSQLGGQKESKPIRGKLFDGEIQMSGEVLLSSATFDVGIYLKQGKVPSLLTALGHGRQELTGAFNVDMDLEGIIGTTDLLSGNGNANVSGANLYQLPLLVQLLNLLRITPTEDVAFTDSTVDFRIVEDQINFDDLKLWGDLVSLHGIGTLDRRHELDLRFNTRVSPKNTFTKIVRPLKSQQYTLWDVDVRGPISGPDVELRPLEGVGQTLERILPGVNIRRVGHTESSSRNLRR